MSLSRIQEQAVGGQLNAYLNTLTVNAITLDGKPLTGLSETLLNLDQRLAVLESGIGVVAAPTLVRRIVEAPLSLAVMAAQTRYMLTPTAPSVAVDLPGGPFRDGTTIRVENSGSTGDIVVRPVQVRIGPGDEEEFAWSGGAWIAL